MRRRHLAALPVLFAALVAACGGEDLTGPEAVDRVMVSPSSATLTAVGETEDFSARPLSASGKRVREVSIEWSTSNPSVAAVDSTGRVTAEGAGSAFVRATVEGTEISGTAELTVDQEVAAIAVDPDSAKIAALRASRTFRLNADDRNGNPVSDVGADWSSTRPSVATVDSTGTAVAVAEGLTEIVAVAEGLADTAKLVVDQRVNTVTLEPRELAGSEGDTFNVSALVTDATGHFVEDADLTWTSTDRAVASVTPTTDTTARVSAVGEGVGAVTAEAANGIGDTARITVGPNVAVETLFVKPRGVLVDSTVTLGAVVANTGAGDVQSLDWVVRRGDGTVLRSGTIDALPQGSADSIPPQADLGPFSAGPHSLELEVDPDDEIAEFRESDNRAAERVESYPRGYDIEFQFVGPVSDSLRSVVRSASERWERVITGDLPDVEPGSPEAERDSIDLNRCFSGAGKRGAPIDDLLMLVRADSIDGEGSVLARAGPCFVRDSDDDPRLPPTTVVGGVEVDTADVGGGSLETIVLHEIGHVLGFGTLWNFRGGDAVGPYQLLEDPGSDDPTFIGPFAIEKFLEIGGDRFDGEPVPVANQGGQGTRDSHWRESVFGNELMTGFLNPNIANPMSSVTVASLADQYYSVDLGEADAFRVLVGGGGAAARLGGAIELGDHLLRVPLYGITPSGEVRRLRRGSPR